MLPSIDKIRGTYEDGQRRGPLGYGQVLVDEDLGRLGLHVISELLKFSRKALGSRKTGSLEDGSDDLSEDREHEVLAKVLKGAFGFDVGFCGLEVDTFRLGELASSNDLFTSRDPCQNG